MRPPKVVLLVDGDEERLGVRRFVFWTWSYGVLSAETGEAALWKLEQAPPGSIDLVAHASELVDMEVAEFRRRSRALHPGVAMMEFNSSPFSTPTDVREMVKQLCEGKRGPKPGFRLEDWAVKKPSDVEEARMLA